MDLSTSASILMLLIHLLLQEQAINSYFMPNVILHLDVFLLTKHGFFIYRFIVNIMLGF